MESLDGVQIPIPLLWLVHQPSSRTWRDLNPPSRARQWGQSKLALNWVCCGDSDLLEGPLTLEIVYTLVLVYTMGSWTGCRSCWGKIRELLYLLPARSS
jgi:hypothetical protein